MLMKTTWLRFKLMEQSFIVSYLERNIRTGFGCSEASHVGDSRKNIHQLHHIFSYFVIWKKEGGGRAINNYTSCSLISSALQHLHLKIYQSVFLSKFFWEPSTYIKDFIKVKLAWRYTFQQGLYQQLGRKSLNQSCFRLWFDIPWGFDMIKSVSFAHFWVIELSTLDNLLSVKGPYS